MITNVAMGNILDAMNQKDPMNLIKQNAWNVFKASVTAAIFNFINYAAWRHIGSEIKNKIKSEVFKSMVKKDVEYFDRNSIGDIFNILSSDVNQCCSVFSGSKTHQLRALGQFLSSLIICLNLEWRLTTFSIISTAVSSYLVRQFKNFAMSNFKMAIKQHGRITTIEAEALSNARIVFSFNSGQYEMDRICKEHEKFIKYKRITSLMFYACGGVSHMFNTGTLCVLLSFGSVMIAKGKMTPGKLFTLERCVTMIGNNVSSIISTLLQEIKALDAASRIFKVIDEDEVIPFDQGKGITGFRGSIEFKDVWFKYPTRDTWVLKGVSFKIDAGQIVAFVGHSGSGKSTIAQLLSRFYDATKGKIYLDGKNIKSINARWIHQSIGLVQQDPILFAMTVKENIAYGVPEASDFQIQHVAQVTNSEKFINKLPLKYETMVGEKGSTLSGGQRQRIAIARALLKDPTIFIADEATSALDAENEKKVQSALEKVIEGRTTIIIAHRLGTIRAASKIFVIESGELVEQGTHEELVAKGGAFFSLVHRQLIKPGQTSLT